MCGKQRMGVGEWRHLFTYVGNHVGVVGVDDTNKRLKKGTKDQRTHLERASAALI
jgi:hypothetical protein